MQLVVKNMVCPRCIWAVEEVLNDLGIAFEKVELGNVVLKVGLSDQEKDDLDKRLLGLGFEILQGRDEKTVNKIESLLVARLNEIDEGISENLSDYLSRELMASYAHLSRLFSQVKGMSVEQHFNNLRIEKAKELLFYGELDNAEVGFQLGYSSPAHFSSAFKKNTGLTPTQFRKLKEGTKGLAS